MYGEINIVIKGIYKSGVKFGYYCRTYEILAGAIFKIRRDTEIIKATIQVFDKDYNELYFSEI